MKDVVYSIDRHRHSKVSQSQPLLENVESVEIVGDHLAIKLKRSQYAIFKVLSREQIGIVPAGWTFNASSTEPYVGSGPYRLVKRDNAWLFVRNDRHVGTDQTRIPVWRIAFRSANPLAKGDLPEYVPLAFSEDLDAWRNNGVLSDAASNIKDFLSFVQSSAWWNPKGQKYRDGLERRLKMGAIRMLFELRAESLGARRATGFIPYGVAGYLPEAIDFKPIERSTKTLVVKIGLPDRIAKEVLAVGDVRKVERTLNVKFEIASINSKADRDKLHAEPDILINRWAGGFNDPEGFLPIIGEIVDGDLKPYFGGLWDDYLNASTEQDWAKRADAFRDLSKKLLQEDRYVPGWKTPIYSVLSKTLTESPDLYRYTPRLSDIGYAQ